MTWLNKLRKALAEWLMPPQAAIGTPIPDPTEQDVADLPQTPEVVAHHTPIAAQPGLVCPECSHKITITIPMLLSGQPFFCHACFLEISVNQTESAAALASLSKLQGEFGKANKIVNQNKM